MEKAYLMPQVGGQSFGAFPILAHKINGTEILMKTLITLLDIAQMSNLVFQFVLSGIKKYPQG